MLVAVALLGLPAPWKMRAQEALQRGLAKLTPTPTAPPPDSLRLRCAALEARCAWLAEELVREREARAALEGLRAALPPEEAPRVRSARVLLHSDPASSFRRGWLSVGSLDGVAEGDLVVRGDVLLGRVIAVTTRRCQAMWLTDPDFRLRARATPTGASGKPLRGVVAGDLDGLRLELLEHPEAVVGSPVLSEPAGFRCGYPLRVGTVSAVEHPLEQPLPRVAIEPALRPESLTLVEILPPRAALTPSADIPWSLR